MRREKEETSAQGGSDKWINSWLNKTSTGRLLLLREELTCLGWDGNGQGGEIVTLVDSGWKRPKKTVYLLESAKFGFAYRQ